MDKMREAIIKFGQDNPVLELDFRLHTHGQYLTQDKAIVASRAFEAGAEWHAAQAASVPVAGKVVGYLAGGTLMRRKILGYDCKPLIVQSTESIPAAAPQPKKEGE